MRIGAALATVPEYLDFGALTERSVTVTIFRLVNPSTRTDTMHSLVDVPLQDLPVQPVIAAAKVIEDTRKWWGYRACDIGFRVGGPSFRIREIQPHA